MSLNNYTLYAQGCQKGVPGAEGGADYILAIDFFRSTL